MPPNHEVKQGDTISSIAFKHGFPDETIWDHPSNAALKRKRGDPDVLMPGDVVFVPESRLRDVTAATGQLHRFRARGGTKTFSIRLLRLDRPVAGAEYEIEIDGRKRSGKTDADGWLREPIPRNAARATLTMEGGRRCDIALGYLDPVDAPSGIQERLRTLGYYAGPIRAAMNDDAVEAVRAFQLDHGLEPTGEADARTQGLLKERAGA
jgi:hypothetical protein